MFLIQLNYFDYFLIKIKNTKVYKFNFKYMIFNSYIIFKL